MERFKQIDKYYKNNQATQDVYFFIIQYYDCNNMRKYFSVGKIFKISQTEYRYVKVTEEIKKIIIDALGLDSGKTYYKSVYYKEYYINSEDDFYVKEINEVSKKIKLKYFSWDELLDNNEVLHQKLIDILFDKNNVIDVASTYNRTDFPIKNKETLIESKYNSILKNIGFISKNGVDITNSVLSGDIGEFLMNIMIAKFISLHPEDEFIFPKLAFKTAPKVAIHGYDGTFYNRSKKEIYYTESKFYTKLSEALNNAVNSMKQHDQIDYDFIESHVNNFRNLASKRTGEIVEISSNIKEKLIIFLICADKYKLNDINKIINDNKKLQHLKKYNEIIVFVLPILNKKEFLELFKKISDEKGKDLLADAK